MNVKEIMKCGLIGLNAEVVDSKNKKMIGIKGKIVDETKNSFKMLVNKRNFREFKVIMKQGNTFMIGKKLFDGNKIMKRPEDRIKLRD